MSAANPSERLAEAQRLCDQDQLAAAAKLYGEVLHSQPGHPVAAHRLGVLACKMGMPDRAIRLLRQSLRAGGESAELLNDLGRAYVETGGWENAWRCFRRCIDRYPGSVLGYVSLAYVENARGNFSEARAAYLAAIERAQNPVQAQSNLAALYREWGQLDEAVSLYDELIEQHLGFASLVEGRARALLQQKKWKAGWQDYEARLAVEDEPARINLDLPIRRWQGEPLGGQRLLILYEQGVGDEVQFASCFADAIQQARECTVTCSPRLLPIFKRCFPEAAFIPIAPADRETWAPEDPPQFDYFVPAGSLPRYFRRHDADFPGRPYLQAARASADTWRNGSRRLRVGVSWWGGAVTEQIQKRSIPLEVFQKILSVPDVQFVNLQHGFCDPHAVDTLLAGFDNLETRMEIDPYRDLEAWFDLIASLDLVISVDNSNVHFAGAMGVPTWLLLSDHPNWRWPLNDERSNWYRSVEFFRKQDRGSWEPSLDGVVRRLSQWKSGVRQEPYDVQAIQSIPPCHVAAACRPMWQKHAVSSSRFARPRAA